MLSRVARDQQEETARTTTRLVRESRMEEFVRVTPEPPDDD